MRSLGLFDQQDCMKKLNLLREPLVAIGESIHFDQFREILERATLQDSYAKSEDIFLTDASLVRVPIQRMCVSTG